SMGGSKVKGLRSEFLGHARLRSKKAVKRPWKGSPSSGMLPTIWRWSCGGCDAAGVAAAGFAGSAGSGDGDGSAGGAGGADVVLSHPGTARTPTRPNNARIVRPTRKEVSLWVSFSDRGIAYSNANPQGKPASCLRLITA